MIMEKRNCPLCGKEFSPAAVNQVFCSTECRIKYNSKYGGYEKYPPKFFICAHCGKEVSTKTGDKRTRFCCSECEKKYWKHPKSRKHDEIARKIEELNAGSQKPENSQSSKTRK